MWQAGNLVFQLSALDKEVLSPVRHVPVQLEENPVAVDREEFEYPLTYGTVSVPRVVRQASGVWRVEFELNFVVSLPDGRRIHVTDHLVSARGVQRGRKPRVTAVSEEASR